jgi:hypothetical protein
MMIEMRRLIPKLGSCRSVSLPPRYISENRRPRDSNAPALALPEVSMYFRWCNDRSVGTECVCTRLVFGLVRLEG